MTESRLLLPRILPSVSRSPFFTAVKASLTVVSSGLMIAINASSDADRCMFQLFSAVLDAVSVGVVPESMSAHVLDRQAFPVSVSAFPVIDDVITHSTCRYYPADVSV